MTVWARKLIAAAISVPIGLGLTSAVIWVFGIDVAPVERWAGFPDDWRLMDLIINAMVVLMVFGTIRAAYRVLCELWITNERPDVP